MDRDLKQGTSKGSICRFPLGTRANVEKYIKQFTEIFTEEGRRSVKITHQVPGQKPTVTYTHTAPSYTPATTTTTASSTLITQAQTLAASINVSQYNRNCSFRCYFSISCFCACIFHKYMNFNNKTDFPFIALRWRRVIIVSSCQLSATNQT